jgi:ATP-dependent protease ClpP protease subunit
MNPNHKKKMYDENETEDETHNLVSVEKNKVMFYAEVNPDTSFKLISCISKAKEYVALHNISNYFEDDMKVYLHICSDGGEICSAWAVIDTILSSKVDIVTVCEGCVASAGVLMSLAGKERYIRKHAYMLIHEIRSGCIGKYSECKDDMKNNDIMMIDIKNYMNDRCQNKCLKKKLNKVLKHDLMWNADKCLKYGLITKII